MVILQQPNWPDNYLYIEFLQCNRVTNFTIFYNRRSGRRWGVGDVGR